MQRQQHGSATWFEGGAPQGAVGADAALRGWAWWGVLVYVLGVVLFGIWGILRLTWPLAWALGLQLWRR